MRAVLGRGSRYVIRRAPLVVAACLAVFGGVAAARWWAMDGGGLAAVAAVLAVVVWRRRSVATVVCVVAACFLLGWWRGSVYLQRLAPYDELRLQKVTLTGRVTEDGVYGERSQLTFPIDRVQVQEPVAVALPGAIAVGGFGERAVYRGDVVQVTGKLYPRRGNVQAGVSFAQLTVLARGSSAIDELRRKFGAGVQSALPEPLASFGMGLLIGQRSTLPDHTAQVLLAVGLSHIIAVSGYNLTIIIEAARRVSAKRSKYQMLAMCLALIGLFLLLTGNSPSIVRASIISVLSIVMWYYGRNMKPLALLLLAAAITVVANPLYLWGNVGWYLSFLAFFGVVVVAPYVFRRWYGARQPPLVMKMLIESLCAEVITLPYVLYIFGQLSTVSLLANVLVAVCVPLAMLLCAVAGLAGMLVPAAAGWFAWPARLLLRYMIDMAELLSRVPHALVQGIGFSLWQMLACYAVIGLWLAAAAYQNRPKYGMLTEKQPTEAEGA